MDKRIYKVGIDVGSTTLKVILLNQENEIVYKAYRRHKANINPILAEELQHISREFPQAAFTIRITGSAGLGLSERTGIAFIQEVVASVGVVDTLYPGTRTLIDLGGEDAKMVFFAPGKQPDIRMNGSCAGGTGAFIDQRADLMHIPVEELGKAALSHEKIYPVASRCGVFAKTDVQNLICRNVPVADVAASILHTVALQCVTSLARGYDIQPKILCVGGPLTFIPALRNAFRELIGVEESDLIVPENGEYFPALGCALAKEPEDRVYNDLTDLIRKLNERIRAQSETLPPLFPDRKAYVNWKENRKIKPLEREELKEHEAIRCFLGIDSGSTTTKILVMRENGRIVYTYYSANEGNPLKKVTEGLDAFYRAARKKKVTFEFLASAATGYGEELVRSALNLNYGIVETMAHLSGAQYVDPEVSFVLDIGGQDIKSLFIDHGIISNIELNEACSSGCGSFLQNFAATMNVGLPAFTEAACLAKSPSDLGSRCTVFMNSKVKQALREGAGIGDIAAGLAYSVVKNCLYKVLKINNLNQLGDHIVVQGGTFRNDAVYRVLEQLSGKSVGSTDHPELMRALGAALYARKMWEQEKRETTFTGKEALPQIDRIDTKELQCKGCTNRCSVLRFRFENGNVSYAGNKCEKMFFNRNITKEKGYDAFEKKNEILFNRTKGEEKENRLPVIGIPRVLNMFENYPFWHRLLTACGFKVVLSPESTFTLYQKGAGSVMSENICFPAKLVHGHIMALAEAKVDRIFYPIVPKEEKEFRESNNSYNCPIVSGYPDVVRSAIHPEERFGIPFDKPVITFSNEKALRKACFDYVSTLGIDEATFRQAFALAQEERQRVKEQLTNEQKQRFDRAVAEGKPVFVVAGRPYHTDPLIHQKVGQILSNLGAHVFTDDLFRQPRQKGFGKLNIVSQWAYPNRVVQAAMEVARLPRNVQLIQLNSFGCGPDSFFMDEIGEILKKAGKNHTILRIDEIASPGSIRLRLRSLIESLRAADATAALPVKDQSLEGYQTVYKKEDRRKTILIPWFADFISPFLPAIGELAGYKMVNLPKSSKASAEMGLKYGHNEVCYPSTLVVGDIIMALQSGKYNLDETVVAITQTGGQCRATNYIAQIKMALQNAGFDQVPVLAISTGEVYQNDQKAFKLPIAKLIHTIIYALLYADGLQQMHSATTIRETTAGESQRLFDFYVEVGIEAIRKNDPETLIRLLKEAVADFNQIQIHDRTFTKIGLIGEIYLKYNSYGQAHITEWLRAKGMEVHTPPIMDFVLPYFVNARTNEANGLKRKTFLGNLFRSAAWKYINREMNRFVAIMEDFRFFAPPESIFQKAEYAAEIVDLSNQFGEGWSIPAEVACYAHQGVNKVICIQPFGCIANHIVARGVEKQIKKLYPEMNILYLDIDGGVAEVNLQNRLHFMLAI